MMARQSTARTFMIGPVLDSAGVAVTGAVVGDFKVSKNGGAPAALNGSTTLTHRHTGMYSLAGAAGDFDTVGTAQFTLDKTTDTCSPVSFDVIEEAVYDALFAASAAGYSTYAGGAVASVTGNVGGNVVGSVGSVVGAVGSVTGAVGSVAGNVGGNVVGSVGSVTARVTANVDQFGGTAGTFTAGFPRVLLADRSDQGGTSMLLTFNRMRGISTDLNEPCIHIDGNGTGAGLECHGGSDGPGIFAWTPAEGRFGIHAKGPGGGMWTEADVNALNEGIGWYSSAKESGGAYGFYAHGALAGLIASGTTGSSASGFQAAGGSLGGHAVLLLRGGAGADDLHLANSDAPTLKAAILTAGAIDATVAPNLDAAVSTRASQTSVDDLPTNAELATALDPLPTANENADALIARNIAGGSSTGRTVGQALAAQRNKVAFDVPAAGQFTVYGTDDVTPLWTGTYTAAAGNPVTALDPA